MGNMCCRRVVYAPNATEADPSRCSSHPQNHHQQLPSKQPQQHTAMSNAYHSTGDDCAINELLEGRMDLDVLMPDGRQVRLTVERRTPMMDLLVQAASATKISPGGHVIHVLGDSNKGSSTLQYKPSTPIGSLDTNTISIVPKKEAADLQARRTSKTANRPFEPTFRVQVHLPRNQLTVLRVSPRVKISELKTMVCKEKGLDTSRYQLVRPSGPTEPLEGNMTLGEYGSTEITLLSNSSIESHICNSTSHIISYPKRNEEQKRKNGILRLLAEDANKKNTSNINSTCHADGNKRNNNTSKSDEANNHQNRYKPKKRRPAPPPPPPVLPEAPSHSRQSSSDSSGYHEATSSFLHEEHSSEEKASSDSSGVSSLDAKAPATQPSPPLNNLKKKKAPAPPPPAPQKGKASSQELLSTDCLSTQRNLAPDPPFQKVSNGQNNSDDNQTNIKIQQKSGLPSFCSEPKDIYAQKDCSTAKDLIKHPKGTMEVNKNSQNNAYVHTVPVLENNIPVSNKSVTSKYPAPQKDPTIEGNRMTKKNNPIYEDNVLSMNNFIQKDRVLPEDRIVSKKNILKDKVPNQAKEGKLDLHPDLLEKDDQSLQASTALVTKGMPSINDSTGKASESNQQSSPLKPQTESCPQSLSIDVPVRRKEKESNTKKEKPTKKGEAVSTRVALVALNARIEQDVTQQEIASSIQAAFHALDCNPQPTLLSIKQRKDGDSTIYSSETSINSLSSSVGSFNSASSKATTIRFPLNEDSCVKESVSETSKRLNTSEKEALLIDEEPPPRSIYAAPAPSKTLRRSSSLLNFVEATPKNISSKNSKHVRHLQRSLSDLSSDGKEDFEAEQERLQREYIKLQRQFILWQQQLMNNHVMLREECIVPQYARTLRQSHSLPEGEGEDYCEGTTTPSVPLVSRSLSYEPTKEKCSTLPRSAINIPSLEFNSIQVKNGTSTLRSSKTKSYFKPPQVRASTKSRQRLPPEIKKEGDVDISDDAKMLTTILPSFESLKLITENNDEDIQSCVSRLKDTTVVAHVVPQDVKRMPLVQQSSTFSNHNSQLNNGNTVVDKNLKCANGDTGQSKLLINCSKMSEQPLNSKPPAPPPMPIGVASKGSSLKENCIKSSGHRNGVAKNDALPNEDPRERLMLEIRKFGGRTALRKISLAS